MTDHGARVLLQDVSSGRRAPEAAAVSGSDERATTLEQAYRTHVGFVWRVVRRLGVPDSALEDVLQDVFLVVRRRLAELGDHPSPRTWLFVIARGVVANYRRISDRRRRREEDATPPAAQRDPEQWLAQSEAVELVSRFLATLGEEQRLAFELVDIEGLSAPEVARMCNVKLNTIYSRLRLARRAFAAFVAELEQGGSR